LTGLSGGRISGEDEFKKRSTSRLEGIVYGAQPGVIASIKNYKELKSQTVRTCSSDGKGTFLETGAGGLGSFVQRGEPLATDSFWHTASGRRWGLEGQLGWTTSKRRGQRLLHLWSVLEKRLGTSLDAKRE